MREADRWLADQNQKIPRTHRMADLLSLIPSEVITGLSDEIILLDRFYIPTCYPDAVPGSLEDSLPEKEEAQEAFDLAKKVLETIGAKL